MDQEYREEFEMLERWVDDNGKLVFVMRPDDEEMQFRKINYELTTGKSLHCHPDWIKALVKELEQE